MAYMYVSLIEVFWEIIARPLHNIIMTIFFVQPLFGCILCIHGYRLYNHGHVLLINRLFTLYVSSMFMTCKNTV